MLGENQTKNDFAAEWFSCHNCVLRDSIVSKAKIDWPLKKRIAEVGTGDWGQAIKCRARDRVGIFSKPYPIGKGKPK